MVPWEHKGPVAILLFFFSFAFITIVAKQMQQLEQELHFKLSNVFNEDNEIKAIAWEDMFKSC